MTPGRPAVRRPVHRSLTTFVAGATVAALVATLPQAAPASADRVPTRLRVDQVAAAAQCNMGLGRAQKGTAPKARALMAGRADLGQYGWFRLKADPSWRPVTTLDSSGKGHMHSLHYLLPLLRRGVKTGNRDFIDRFYFLIHDWVRDNKPGARSPRDVWDLPTIYEGFRSLVLVCAAAGPRCEAPWLLRDRNHGRQAGVAAGGDRTGAQAGPPPRP